MVREYKYRIGSRAQVMHGTAKMTGGGLIKKQLKYNKHGKIVSRKASRAAKKSKNLIKAGYITKKGQFGAAMAKVTPFSKNKLTTPSLREQWLESNNIKETLSSWLKTINNKNSSSVNAIKKFFLKDIKLFKKQYLPSKSESTNVKKFLQYLTNQNNEELNKIFPKIDSKKRSRKVKGLNDYKSLKKIINNKKKSGIISGINSNKKSGIISGINSNKKSGIISGINSNKKSGIISGINSKNNSGIISGINSKNNSGIISGINSKNNSGIISGINSNKKSGINSKNNSENNSTLKIKVSDNTEKSTIKIPIDNGELLGCVGLCFERMDKIDYKLLFITKKQNTIENGYGPDNKGERVLKEKYAIKGLLNKNENFISNEKIETNINRFFWSQLGSKETQIKRKKKFRNNAKTEFNNFKKKRKFLKSWAKLYKPKLPEYENSNTMGTSKISSIYFPLYHHIHNTYSNSKNSRYKARYIQATITSYNKDNYQNEAVQGYIDRHLVKKRYKFVIKPFLEYCNNLAKERGKKAYVRVSGIGLGAQLIYGNEQKTDYLEVFKSLLGLNKYSNIENIVFMKIVNSNEIDNELINPFALSHNINGVKISYTNNISTNLQNVNDKDKLLILMCPC